MTIDDKIKISYFEYVKYLNELHGSAIVPYFVNPSCKTKNNKISRTSEGLLCHHVDEYYYPLLSDSSNAAARPWECQLPDRLVYCTEIEHLLLHVKIVVEQMIEKESTIEVGTRGIYWTAKEIASFYAEFPSIPYKQKLALAISEQYDDFLKILRFVKKKGLWEIIDLYAMLEDHESLENVLNLPKHFR